MKEIASDEVRAELDRVVASPGFVDAGRLGPFLRFLVESALAGESAKLKESVLGGEVFQRPADYDPRTDPIVRVEARRLRSRLEEYYQAHPEAPVRIALPKGGYIPAWERAPAPAGEQASAHSQAAAGPARKAHSAKLLAGAALGVLLLAAGILKYREQPLAIAEVHSVVVLPFLNLSPDPQNEYFSDGLTTELTDALTKSPNLRVIAWSSAAQYKGKSHDIPEIGRRFKVDSVIEGSVRKDGNQLRITAQLIRTSDGQHLWSQSYDREWKDIFAVQRDLARAIAATLQVPAGAPLMPGREAASLDAYSLYLQGRHHMGRLSEAEFLYGLDYLKRAVDADPKFAPAYAGMAAGYTLIAYYRAQPQEQALRRAHELADQAIALDPNLAEAHSALGLAYGMGEWNWTAAKAECEKALALNPGSADAHLNYVIAYLLPAGRLDEASRELKRSIDLDPLGLPVSFILGYTEVIRGNYPAAVEHYKRSIELAPEWDHAWWDLGWAYALNGQKEEALQAWQRSAITRKDREWRPGMREYALLGEMDRARQIGERRKLQRESLDPVDRARDFAMIGDRETAFFWLEKGYREHDSELIWMKLDPRLVSLHGDPRFKEMLVRMKLD